MTSSLAVVPAESTPAGQPDAPEPCPRKILGRLAAHRLLAGLVAAGVVLRVAMHIAYPHAFYFDDSRAYLQSAIEVSLSSIRPFGYSAFLMLWGTGNPVLVAAVQHAMAVGLAIGIYAFLRRRAVRPVFAALAVAPFLLGPSELVLEHYILAETLYTVLTVGGLILLTLVPRGSAAPEPGTRWKRLLLAVTAGLLLAFAAATRSVGLPLCALALAYLLLTPRRTGWLSLAGFVLAVGLPLGGYLVAYENQHRVYAFGEYQGRFLYARTMTFADCETLPLTDREMLLCAPVSRAERPNRLDYYIWSTQSPASVYFPGPGNDPQLNAFAKKVIMHQPGDFAAMIGQETAWHFLPWLRPADPQNTCLYGRWLPNKQRNVGCAPEDFVLPASMSRNHQRLPATEPTAVSRALDGYGSVQVVAGPLMLAALLWILVAAVVRIRRSRTRDLLDGLVLAAAGLGMITASVATSMFELRYAVPAVPLILIGAALLTRRTNPSQPAR